MTAVTWKDQPRALQDGVLQSSGEILFTDAATGEPMEVYADPALTVPAQNPLPCDAAGRFMPIWLDLDLDYRARLFNEAGVQVWDENPLEVFPDTQTGIPLSDDGETMPNCVLTFWRAGTTILAQIYDANTLTSQLDNPLTANDDGEFPQIWIDDDLQYRVKLEDGSGRLIFDIDDYQAIPDVIVPPAPVVLSGDIEDVSGVVVNLQWTEATTGTFAIDHYDIYRSVDGGAFIFLAEVSALDPREHEDTGLAVDTQYRYFVIAVDTSENESDASNTLSLQIASSDDIIDIYTTSDTWTKRPGLVTADVYVIGGGGGGGSGFSGTGSTTRTGGGGAGGGGYSSDLGILAASLGATETVTVGTGGAGGTGVTGTSSTGNSGSAGGTSSFGAHTSAAGGAGGRGGGLSIGTNGAGGLGDVAGGDGGVPALTPNNGQSSTFGGGGGGNGGSRDNSGPFAPGSGGTGASSESDPAIGGAAGATNGAPGDPGESSSINRAGGGGGGGRTSNPAGSGGGSGGTGGGGGTYGGAGGGGGSRSNSATPGTSGAGGVGANGIVIVVSRFT